MAVEFEPKNVEDPLSGLLSRFCLPDWSAGVAVPQSPWAIHSPPDLIAFYAIQSGQCQLILPGQLPVVCHAGDQLLMTHGTAHQLCDEPDSPTMSFQEFRRLRPVSLNRPHATVIIHGYCSVGPSGRNLLRDSLPAVVLLSQASLPNNPIFEQLAAMIMNEAISCRPGWQACVERSIQLAFVQTVRAYFCSAMNGQNGSRTTQTRYLRAVNDPQIGQPLRMMHAEPGKPWTVPLLARQARISKSAFSERFREILGQPPLQYLTEFRMQKACELLKESDLSVKHIANTVGYESASSFSNTFKRWVGCTPADYRKNGSVDE